jgi:hypothetical protein
MTNQVFPTYDLHKLAAPLLAVIDAAPDQFARLMALQNLLLAGQPVSCAPTRNLGSFPVPQVLDH